MAKVPTPRHAGAQDPNCCGHWVRECPAFAAQAPRHSPLRPGRRCPAPRPRPPAPRTHLLLLRGGCLGDFGGHTALSADETPGKDAITGGRGRRPPQARPPRSPSARPPGRLRPRKWPAPCDDRAAWRSATPSRAPRPPPPASAAPQPTWPRGAARDARALPLSVQGSRRLAPRSHPPARCFLGLGVCRRSRLSPPFLAHFHLPKRSWSLLLFALGSAAMQVSFRVPGPRCCCPAQGAPLLLHLLNLP